MPFPILASIYVLSAVTSTHLIRFGQKLGRRMVWVGALLYVTAGVGCGLWALFVVPAGIGWSPAICGLVTGALLGGTYCLYNATIRQAGVGVAHSMRQVSVVLPFCASVVVWADPLGPLGAAGAGLAILSMLLLFRGSGKREARKSKTIAILPVMMWLLAGLTRVGFKAYAEQKIPEGRPVFLTCTFFVAGAAVMVLAMMTDGRPDRKDVAHGALLGVVNILLNYLLVVMLAEKPGTMVFPLNAVAVLVVSSVAAMVLWGERYRGRVLAGILVAVAAVVLIGAAMSEVRDWKTQRQESIPAESSPLTPNASPPQS